MLTCRARQILFGTERALRCSRTDASGTDAPGATDYRGRTLTSGAGRWQGIRSETVRRLQRFAQGGGGLPVCGSAASSSPEQFIEFHACSRSATGEALSQLAGATAGAKQRI